MAAVTKTDVAAGSGVLTGLVSIVLPLAQALPSHLSTGTVETAVAGGLGLVAVSVLGHLGLSPTERTKVTKVVQTVAPEIAGVVAQVPALSSALADINKRLAAVEANPVAGEIVTALRGLATPPPPPPVATPAA